MTQTTLARSWISSANGHRDFPLQNLPLGIFSIDGSASRSGVAIGDAIFDLRPGWRRACLKARPRWRLKPPWAAH